MFWLLASLLAALGIYALLARRSLVGWMVGGQLIFLSISTFFVQAGIQRAEMMETQLGALYLILFGAIFTGVALGLTVRQFILTRDVGRERMEEE